jgi:hypothetical protein
MDDAAREPADELRALYGRLEPPPLADGVEEADADTQRVARWMQAAWRGIEPPRALRPPERALAPHPHRSWHGRRVRWLVIAAAAAVLLAAGGLFLLSRPAPATRPLSSETAAPAPDSPAGIEVLAIDPERVELRSGPVRLVLLDPPELPSSDSAGT